MADLAVPLNAGGEGDEKPPASCLGVVGGPVFVYYVVAIGLSVLVSYGVYYEHFRTQHLEKQLPCYKYTLPYEILAVLAAILASSNSTHHIMQHIFYNRNSWSQKVTILVILSMVPVYAICSALALVYQQNRLLYSVLLTAFREFYEAMVLIAFMQFIAEFWGGTLRLARTLDTEDLVFQTIFPTPARKFDEILGNKIGFSLASTSVFPIPRAPGSEYVAYTYLGALQYAAVMVGYVLVNLLMRSLVLRGKMTEAGLAFGLQLFNFVKIVSNFWAMWNLFVLFEYLRECRNTEQRMNRIRPFSKFVCIKLIVLFSLWQENIMKALAKMDLLPVFRGWNEDWSDEHKTGEAAVNFLVCLEMILFAQWHRYAYPYDENWVEERPARRNYQPCCCFLRFGVGMMADDVLYILCNRLPGQHRCVNLVAKARKVGQLSPDEAEELARKFRYFDLDEDEGEASSAQLRHILVRSGLARSMEEAEARVRAADFDGNGRLSFAEFQERLMLTPGA